MTVFNRRMLIAGGFSLAALAGVRPVRAQGASPFTQGVASGDPAADGFVIWTRLAPDPLAPDPLTKDGLGGLPAPARVRWTVYSDNALKTAVASGEVTTSVDDGHSVHVEIGGLKPDRPYWYRFDALGAQSRIGRARTLPLPGAKPERLRLAFASCSNFEAGYFSAYRHMIDEQPDFVMYLGDYIYESSYAASRAAVRRHERRDDPRTLGDYRRRYALYHTDPDLQDLRAATTALMTWDDHEVQNDYGDFQSEYMKDDVLLPMLRANAYQAYYEAMPLRAVSRPHGPYARIYKSYRFGALAEINMLDGRQYRSPAACPVGDIRKGHVTTCAGREDAHRTMLGFEQEAWLYDRFARSQAQWNLMGQDLLVAPFLQKGTDKTGQSVTGHWTDAWDGYPATRTRLLQAMQRTRVKNPVMLGGDIHSFWANDLKLAPEGPTIASEFVGTSITSDNPRAEGYVDMLPQNPHVKYLGMHSHGYVVLDADRRALDVRFRAISDRVDAKASIATEKHFNVENGRPGVIIS